MRQRPVQAKAFIGHPPVAIVVSTRISATTLLAVLVSAGFAGCLQGDHPTRAGTPLASTGLVSTVHPLASEAGADMLRRGGNFVDAAAAVQWALNMVEP